MLLTQVGFHTLGFVIGCRLHEVQRIGFALLHFETSLILAKRRTEAASVYSMDWLGWIETSGNHT